MDYDFVVDYFFFIHLYPLISCNFFQLLISRSIWLNVSHITKTTTTTTHHEYCNFIISFCVCEKYIKPDFFFIPFFLSNQIHLLPFMCLYERLGHIVDIFVFILRPKNTWREKLE